MSRYLAWAVVALVSMAVVGRVSAQDEPLEGVITALVWNTDGDALVVGTTANTEMGCTDGIVFVYIPNDSSSTSNILSDEERCGIVDIDFSYDGALIFVQNAVAKTKIWKNTVTYEYQFGMGIGADVTALDAAPTQPLFARVLFNTLVEIISYEAPNFDASLIDLEPLLVEISDITWSPSSDQFAASGLGGQIGIWDAQAGSLSQLIEYDLDNGKTAIDWSAQEEFIAFGDLMGTVVIWNLVDSEAKYRFEGNASKVNDLDWHPDGTMLASASEDGTVRVWNTESGDLLETFTYTGPVYALDWSPDGTQIAFGGADTTGNPPQVMIVDAPQLPEITPTPIP